MLYGQTSVLWGKTSPQLLPAVLQLRPDNLLSFLSFPLLLSSTSKASWGRQRGSSAHLEVQTERDLKPAPDPATSGGHFRQATEGEENPLRSLEQGIRGCVPLSQLCQALRDHEASLTWVSLKSFTPTQYTVAPRSRERFAWNGERRQDKVTNGMGCSFLKALNHKFTLSL